MGHRQCEEGVENDGAKRNEWCGVGIEEQVEKRMWEGAANTKELWKSHMKTHFYRSSLKYIHIHTEKEFI